MNVFAGYDGGGSKTVCALTDNQGTLLGIGQGGPSNYLFCGEEIARASMREATRNAFLNANIEEQPLDTVYIGSAAIKMQCGEAHIPFFRTCCNAKNILCDSDIRPIWYGAVRDAPAIILIAGTGAIAYMCKKGSLLRVGGWGPQFGDEGSGYDVGRRAVQEALRMMDGRVPMEPTFANGVLAFFNAGDEYELLHGLRRAEDNRSRCASAAREVVRLWEQGSSAAQRILRAAAEELALAVNAVLDRMNPCDKPVPLVLWGGLLGPESPVGDMLCKTLKSGGSPISEYIMGEIHPAVAATALALRAAGLGNAAESLLRNTGRPL